MAGTTPTTTTVTRQLVPITHKDLIAAGYVKHDNTFFGRNADCAFQKFIKDVDGETEYVINVLFFRFDDKPKMEHISNAYQVNVQFYQGRGTFDISFVGESVLHIETTCREFWQKMGMDMDHHN